MTLNSTVDLSKSLFHYLTASYMHLKVWIPPHTQLFLRHIRTKHCTDQSSLPLTKLPSPVTVLAKGTPVTIFHK